jgi:acetyl-CoA acetyltransferase
MSDPIVILSAKRTPMGGFQGALAPQSAPELGSAAIKAALEESAVSQTAIDQAIMGRHRRVRLCAARVCQTAWARPQFQKCAGLV